MNRALRQEGGLAFLPAAPAVIDGEAWAPELSPDGFVGLFFRWHEGGAASESRLHLYAACQSYLPKACLDFSILVHCAAEVETCKADVVCVSDEAQWLRAACERNRARIIAEVCASMGVRVPTVQDYRATDPRATPIALVTTETLHNDLVLVGATRPGGGIVRVLNYCSDARTAFNGSICVMSPWEGLWVFRGALGRDDSGELFGLPHGKAGVVLPTASPRVRQRGPSHLSFTTASTRQCKALQVWGGKPKHLQLTLAPEPIFALPHAVRRTFADGIDPDVLAAYERAMAQRALPTSVSVPNVPGSASGAQKQHYLEFDEHVLQRMARLGWNRSHGVAKLIPLACALYDHWNLKDG